MYTVKVSNIITGVHYQSKFETEQEAQDWITLCTSKDSWGKSARVVTSHDTYDESLIISQEFGVDEYGNPTSAISLKAEYEVTGPTLIDINGTSEESKQERLRIATEKAAYHKKHVDMANLVTDYFAAMINERNLTDTQRDELQTNTEILSIMHELQFARIGKVNSMLSNITTDETIIFQEDVDNVKLLIQDFLDSL